MELPNKKNLNQLDFLNNKIKNNVNENTNFLNQSISNSKIYNQKKKIENILIIDTETTGLDENKDEIIEIGSILFNVTTKSVLSQVSFLLPVSSNEAEQAAAMSGTFLCRNLEVYRGCILPKCHNSGQEAPV